VNQYESFSRIKFINKHFIILVTLLLVPMTNVMAHHSAVAFDLGNTVTISGTVTNFIWRSPHSALTLEVKNDNGQLEEWKLEGGSLKLMVNKGFSREDFKQGDVVTAMAHPMRNGKPGGQWLGITLADGRSRMLLDPRRISSQADLDSNYSSESWQEREAKTRPEQLPLINEGAQVGALDPANLERERPAPPFDLTGNWRFRLERPWQKQYGAWEFLPIPELTAKAQVIYDERKRMTDAGERYADPTAYCYPPGVPRLMTRIGAFMAIQKPTAIYMVHRFNNEFRTIFLDDRERIPANVRQDSYNGESLGHWEGNTLVIETVGFGAEQQFVQGGIPTGNQLTVIERLSMINDGNTLVNEMTFTDPEHWIGEWKHVKFHDRILHRDVEEFFCLQKDNQNLPGFN
jgi:hypothetical protein